MSGGDGFVLDHLHSVRKHPERPKALLALCRDLCVFSDHKAEYFSSLR